MMIPVTKFFDELRQSDKFFSVTARRKRDKKVDGEIVERAGTPFTSTYRLNVPATKKAADTRLDPGVRRAEDTANNIITAYDVTKLDDTGEKGAFRRINLNGVESVRALGKTYTAVYVSHPVDGAIHGEWYLKEDE